MAKKQNNNICLRCGSKIYKNSESHLCSRCDKYNYLKKYFEDKRVKKERFKKCQDCNSEEDVMPFVGLCRKCYNDLRPMREMENG